MHNRIRRKIKGAISMLMTASMLAGMLSGIGGAFVSHADTPAAVPPEKVEKGLRAVVDEITDLPYVSDSGVFNREQWLSSRGTKERPFTILEIVGYKDQGEFGYLVGGCEPVNVEEMQGYAGDGIADGFSMNTADTMQAGNDYYFFPDEKEGSIEYYQKNTAWAGKSESSAGWQSLRKTGLGSESSNLLKGYYEVVEDGEGTHILTMDGGSPAFVMYDNDGNPVNGNLVWHTLNNFELNYYPYNEHSFSFSRSLAADDLSEIGDKYYTMRRVSASDPVVAVRSYYYAYHNREVFLRNSLDLTEEKAYQYSVVIKTITPEELNDTPEWADYADLIYITPFSHFYENGDTLGNRWHALDYKGDPLNRLGVSEERDTNYKKNVFEINDLSWDVVMRLYNRVVAKENYAAVILDNRIYDFSQPGYLTSATVKEVAFQVHDYNYQPLPSSYYDGAREVLPVYNKSSKNNFYKLSVLLLSMNPNLINELFVKKGYVVKDAGKDTGIMTLQPEEDPEIDDPPADASEWQKEQIKAKKERFKDAREYWSGYTFMLLNTAVYPGPNENPGTIFNSSEYWQSIQAHQNLSEQNYKSYVYGHVYTYNGNSSISQAFVKGGPEHEWDGVGANNDIFDEFTEYLEREKPGQGLTAHNAYPAFAVRFILGLGNQPNLIYGGNVKVLDLEPSVGLHVVGPEGSQETVPDWKLTETELRMMMPNFSGSIEITHQTSSEFVGKIEDLNSTYDMIYLGMDYSAFRTFRGTMDWLRNSWGGLVTSDFTDFNDNSMDGRIYFHIGDLMKVTGYGGSEAEPNSGNFLLDGSGNLIDVDKELRFPGNDITKLKLDELKSFIAAGHPIAAANEIYDTTLEAGYVDPTTYMHELMGGYRDNGVYKYTDTSSIEEKLRNAVKRVVTFYEYPAIYNGETKSDPAQKNKILAPNYLEARTLTQDILLAAGTSLPAGTTVNGSVLAEDTMLNAGSVLPAGTKLDARTLYFRFNVAGSGYSYRLYVDMDRDSKFELGANPREDIMSGPAGNGQNVVIYPFTSNLAGVIQWKLEVYKTNNPNIRSELTGCSAIQPDEKKRINVLQIMPYAPDPADDKSPIDLSTDGTFQTYMKVEEFEIKVTAITWDQFENYFDVTQNPARKFTYDLSRPVTEDYPSAAELAAVEAVPPANEGISKDLNEYDMLILGFRDTYGSKDLSDYTKDPNNSALMYLQYFAAAGKSILYTHDVTSMYNTGYELNGTKLKSSKFGSTANAALRDQMGMNRYAALSVMLKYMRNGGGMQDYIKNYQAGKPYDTKASAAAGHGYTYFSLKKLGYYDAKQPTANANVGNSVPYQYMIKKPSGEYVYTKLKVKYKETNASTGTVSNKSETYDYYGTAEKQQVIKFAVESGFNSETDLTEHASNLNKGQITEYPYKISDTLPIARTHAEWYQLNLEDEDVTVWYCLANDESNAGLTYGVSPNDAANNYYIYSKDNIFYSGVGHTTADPTTGKKGFEGHDMEAKLFVNTMVAAYRQTYEAPRVEITNREAVKITPVDYRLQVLREYISSDVEMKDIGDEDHVAICFKPKDKSFSYDLSCRIKIEGTGDYVPNVFKKGTGAECEKGSENEFLHLINENEYYFLYPKSWLGRSEYKLISFEVWNEMTDDHGMTELTIDIQPLFFLD